MGRDDPHDRHFSMADAGPAERVLSEGRADLLAYREKIASSTEDDHGPELEQQIGRACAFYRRLAIRTTDLASQGVTPTRLRNHSTWSVAEALYVGALELLAVGFAVRYPKPGRPLPIREVKALVERRVGPLCTGWPAGGSVAHNDHYPCPVHDTPPT